MNKLKKEGSWRLIITFLGGAVIGCFIMYLSHKDIYHHYNTCQEEQLIRKIENINDSNTYTIKDCKIVKNKTQ